MSDDNSGQKPLDQPSDRPVWIQIVSGVGMGVVALGALAIILSQLG